MEILVKLTCLVTKQFVEVSTVVLFDILPFSTLVVKTDCFYCNKWLVHMTVEKLLADLNMNLKCICQLIVNC